MSTWQHAFTEKIHHEDRRVFHVAARRRGGRHAQHRSVAAFGGGGGIGRAIPGTSLTYGVLNYTMFQLSKKDFLTVRNEWWRDEHGKRSGFAGNYTSHAIGLTHNFNDVSDPSRDRLLSQLQ